MMDSNLDSDPRSDSFGTPRENIEVVKKLKIKGKTVTVPESLKKGLGVSRESTLDKLATKEKREARRKARKALRKVR